MLQSITKTNVCTPTKMIHSIPYQKMSATFIYKYDTHNLNKPPFANYTIIRE